MSTKIRFLFQTGLISLVLLPMMSSCVLAQSQPNVLLIMADDLRPQLGCYGDSVALTPHIDQLAAKGYVFERAYVQSAICSPSRNSMLGGMRPNSTGLRGFGVTLRERVPEVITLPQHFMTHGYHAKGIGKIFHVYVESMLGSENDPLSWSEPLVFPDVPVWGPEQNAIRNQLIQQARSRGEEFNHPHDWPRGRTWDDSDIPDEQMQDGKTAQLAEEFLLSERAMHKPFFLAVGFVRPHLPFNAPRKYWDLYHPETLPLPQFRQRPEGTARWTVNVGIVKNYYQMQPLEELDSQFLKQYMQAYLACISYVDACTGRVLNALKQGGHEQKTVVVFVGDHGYQMGEYDSWGHKHSNFEISTRAPLIVRLPGQQSARRVKSITEFLDIYPSLCEIAGLPIPGHLEGISFASMLSDLSRPHRTAAGSEMTRRKLIGRSLRTDQYRYTEWRTEQGELSDRELYDHHWEAEQSDQLTFSGTLETRNWIESDKYQSVLPDLQSQLQQLIPHENKK